MAAEQSERGGGRRRLGLRLALSLVLGGALAWMLVHGGLPIVPAADAFRHVRPWAVPVYVATLVAVHWFRASRWRFLLRPVAEVPLREVMTTSWLGFAAILFLPLRAGEVVRPYLVAKRSSVRGWEAAGTVGAERVIDGLVLSAALFAALAGTTPLDPLPERVGELPVPVATVPGAAWLALCGFTACFALMVAFYATRQRAAATTGALVGMVSRRLGSHVAAILARVADGLRFLPAGRALAPFVAETALYWGLNAIGLCLLARGCGLEAIGLGEATVVMGCLGIGILVPAGPGYFGTFQISVYLALATYVVPERVASEGSAFVFLAYVCQLGQHALGALAAWLWDRAAHGRP